MDAAYDSGDALQSLFVSLAHFHPSSVYYIYATVIAEQFGYGFWLCCLYDVFDLCG
jgi:hypothetical protein